TTATLTRGFPGAGFIALRSGVPVIPVAIWGSEKVLAKGSLIPHSAPVTVRIGRPLTIQRRGSDGRRLSSQDAVDVILREVAAMLPEGRRGVYDGRPGEPTAA
ncbi:MAG TPA: 1-acyl-sn-glycerol-3-phosphate acyltransferase, partial [Candidatus Dormibacteraeota bacterium]|nr:1-acyl-sn-glycerol-3-phosphate acyltransferase [Candidatus Dormibacteraeota bacterium]